MADQQMAFIGRDGNRLVVTAMVDMRDAETTTTVMEYLREGLVVERVQVEWVRKYLFTDEPSPKVTT